MKVLTLKLGYLSTNCYFIVKNNKCFIVDPGDESHKIIDLLNKYNLKVIGILITHNHFDHIKAVNDIQEICKCNVYSKNNLKEGKIIIDNFEFEVIYTPGHSKDSITYYFEKEKVMFTGDFLFKNTIGRYDLEDSNYNEMKNSIEKIKKYNLDIMIYPGHGEYSNMKNELKNNKYLN